MVPSNIQEKYLKVAFSDIWDNCCCWYYVNWSPQPFSESILCTAMGAVAPRPALLQLCGHPVATGEPFSAPKNLTRWSWGASPVPLFEAEVSGWWSADAVIWESLMHGSVRWSHALREQRPAGNSHFHSCVAIPRHDGNCTRLYFSTERNMGGWVVTHLSEKFGN